MKFRMGREQRFLSGFTPISGANLWMWKASVGSSILSCCFVLFCFFFPSPAHSSRTSPSLTLQTKALSSSPPVTAMLFVAGSKLTQKTEPGHKIKQENNYFNINININNCNKSLRILEDIVVKVCMLIPLCLEKVRSLSSCSSSASISFSVSHPSSSPAFPGSSKSTSPKSSAKSSNQQTQ